MMGIFVGKVTSSTKPYSSVDDNPSVKVTSLPRHAVIAPHENSLPSVVSKKEFN